MEAAKPGKDVYEAKLAGSRRCWILGCGLHVIVGSLATQRLSPFLDPACELSGNPVLLAETSRQETVAVQEQSPVDLVGIHSEVIV